MSRLCAVFLLILPLSLFAAAANTGNYDDYPVVDPICDPEPILEPEPIDEPYCCDCGCPCCSCCPEEPDHEPEFWDESEEPLGESL